MMPPFDVLKVVFARFQKEELASGEVAIPKSPIPPARASGEIRRNGTAVVTTLIRLTWALENSERAHKSKRTVSFKAVDFIG